MPNVVVNGGGSTIESKPKLSVLLLFDVNMSIERPETKIIALTGSQTPETAYIRCAVRLLAISKGIYEVCGLPMAGTPELKQVPDLPVWAKNICAQLQMTIFKRLVEMRPEANQADWRNAGRMLGVWQRLITFLAEAWKDTECVSPAEATAPSEVPSDSFAMIPQCDLLQSEQEWLTFSFVNSRAQNPSDQEEFFAGLHEGHKLFLDTNGQFTGDRGRTKVYLVLLANWMEIEDLRQSNPGTTRRDLYGLLALELGDRTGERLPWFNDVCDEIGLRTTEPGRPSKSRKK